MRPMNTKTILVASMIAVASLTLGGCGKGNRDLAYAKVQIRELEAQLAQRDAELAACLAGHTTDTGTVKVQNDGTMTGVEQGSRDREIVFSVNADVLFKPGKAVLDDKAKQTLAQV